MITLSQKDALRMLRVPRLLHHLVQLTCMLLTLLVDAAHFLWLCLHSPTALTAENLFLRKQLALYQERQVTPWRATDATRLALLWLGRWFDWHQALVIVQPATFLRWHRQGFRWFWRWKATPGRPVMRKNKISTLLSVISGPGRRRSLSRYASPIALDIEALSHDYRHR
jgi:hypothetical protein